MAVVESVDYVTKRVHLSAATVGVDIDTLDVYREVRALRRTNENHRKFRPMVISGGNVVKIPGVSYTLPYVQLLNGCRLVPYDASHTLRMIRDTFTDDGFAGRDCFDRSDMSVSVEVDIDVDVEKIEIRVVNGSGTVPTADAVASAVLNRPIEGALTTAQLLRGIAADAMGTPAVGATADKFNVKAAGGTADRIVADVDADGRRSNVVLTLGGAA